MPRTPNARRAEHLPALCATPVCRKPDVRVPGWSGDAAVAPALTDGVEDVEPLGIVGSTCSSVHASAERKPVRPGRSPSGHTRDGAVSAGAITGELGTRPNDITRRTRPN
jgi:hypothetical protein